MVSPTFASMLRSGRAEFNARFAAARRRHRDLDGSAFAEFLQSTVDGLVQAVERVRSDRVAEVARAAYDTALELIGHKLAGQGARHSWVDQGWQRVLPKAAALVAAAPEQMLASVSNALFQLAGTPGARPGQWIASLEALAPQCADVNLFLKVGQVAAWRAGLAHFRSGAMAVADTLPETLALAAVGAPSSARWSEVRTCLLANPWFDPAHNENGSTNLRVVAQAGAFRGFGGLFTEPPRVAPAGDHFLVGTGDCWWLLAVDLFGATFHRSSMEEFERARKQVSWPPSLQVNDSSVVFRGTRFEFPTLGKLTSAAANATTLALTSPLTHAVTLVALPPEP